MAIHLNPYLNFRDSAREAMGFYQSVLGGELSVMTLGEFQMADDPAEADKVMHAQLETPTGLILQGADVPNSMGLTPGDNVSVSLHGDDNTELQRYWDGLTAGGTIIVPFEVAPWGDRFGMFVDRFGINWLVNGAPE
ncbi:PhnB protein [Microbacteriaceae bacterium SG_E_30_P1]|uniref:PhnB protein n=1 Tax=Antiquaquibacter oligotrophicus TaxID=2880260 RepID=A0ABT6KJJ4_9MICO|nr:VOC family protein [Antiquaquibacter oligotrophicus]MDH6180168.1 PhnB protein [Antiquaquibacter oligotrophicus]UDF14080.1 VOC family protein [Antiquaquibacter oligotrophicus]